MCARRTRSQPARRGHPDSEAVSIVDSRRGVLAGLAGAGAFVLAGCGTLEYHRTYVRVGPGTTVERRDAGWAIDGAVRVQFGNEFDQESIKGVGVEAYAASDTPIGGATIGTVTDPDPGDPTEVERGFEFTTSAYPRRIAVTLPEVERTRLCGGERYVGDYVLPDDASSGYAGSLRDGPWELRERACPDE